MFSPQIQTLGAAYDYASVMHYGAYDFSYNGKPTIVAKFSGAESMGQREHYSKVDWWKLRTLYECRELFTVEKEVFTLNTNW